MPKAEMCNHVLGRWVWLLVPLGVCSYHGNGEEKLRVVEELGHFQFSKSRCVGKLGKL